MDFNNNQKYSLLSKMGYTGPSEGPSMEAFIESNPGIAARMGKFTKALQTRVTADGRTTTFAEGGEVSPSTSEPRWVAAGYVGTGPDKKPQAKNTQSGELVQGANGQDLTEYVDQRNAKHLESKAANQPAPVAPGQVLTDAAIQDPTDLILKSDVSKIDANTKGTDIAKDVGQVTQKTVVNTATVNNTATAANPKQDSTATMNASQSESAVNKVVRDLTGADGTVSSDALVTGAQGSISADALADSANFNKNNIVEVDAGQRVVADDELATAATLDNVPQSAAAQLNTPPEDVTAATFDGTTPTAAAQDSYNLTPTNIAAQKATAVQEAATASVYPTAQEAQSSWESTIQAAKGTVGSDELVNAKDIVAAATAVTAVAATMDQLNADAVANAAQGSFSQTALASAAIGSVPPSSTVQGQMDSLMQQFDDGTPAWAAGAMRAANSAMASRGLGGSSMAGAAIVQAVMESAIPIAAQDAQTFAQMNMANLNNQQQVALSNAAAQQNMELTNLNNRQQSALQNSASAFSLQSQNLSNTQAVVLANAQFKASLQEQVLNIDTQAAIVNAAKYSEMNQINLNNRQQATIQNSAQNLQVDMANLSNTQQTALSNLQVRASLVGQELSNDQQMAVLKTTQDFERANFDASAKQQAFLQDASARAALEGKAMDARQQTQIFNVSAALEERQVELSNEQQTSLFNSTNKLSVDMANLSNRQQTALANAQIDAAIKGQELSNKQQVAVLNAEKFAEAANLTYTADQQAKLYNSQLLQSVGTANMNAQNAAILQNAAALANMDMANLNNRQQAASQNASAFLQMDMANLDNEQQAIMFKSQSQVQALFTDQAADNAAKQFNAASKNQADQFFADLSSRVSIFNAEQKNAINQFNAGEKNASNNLSAQLEAQRKQFNETNSLVIAQANAQWRQNVATTNTAAQNESNLQLAQTANGLTLKAMDEIWQRERDTLAYAFTALMSEQDRAQELLLGDKKEEAAESAAKSATWMTLVAGILGF